MTAKEYLQSVRLANSEADRRISRLEHYRDCAGYGTGKREATRISGTSQRSRVEDNVCALVEPAGADADNGQEQNQDISA